MLQNLEQERERATRGTKGTRILCFLCFLWLDPLTFEGFATPSFKGESIFPCPVSLFRIGQHARQPGVTFLCRSAAGNPVAPCSYAADQSLAIVPKFAVLGGEFQDGVRTLGCQPSALGEVGPAAAAASEAIEGLLKDGGDINRRVGGPGEDDTKLTAGFIRQ